MNKFIAKLDSEDVFITISQAESVPSIKIATHENESDKNYEIKIFKYITEFINFTFQDRYFKSILNFDSKDYEITFDNQSSSSFKKFKEVIETIKNKKYVEIFYESGNIKYRSEMMEFEIDGFMQIVPHGNGIHYYDDFGEKIKYFGEFEKGNYDGYGTFVSKDKLFSIVCTTISNNIPIDNITLKINNDSYEDEIISVQDIWEMESIQDKNMKKNFVLSDDFVSKVIDNFTDYNNNEIKFMNMNLSQQNLEIYRELLELKNLNSYNKDYDNNVSFKSCDSNNLKYLFTFCIHFLISYNILKILRFF
tara:strand:+ start:4121 stop:5041 length:921 start_codon:yes stop_codon:yes gene_type:complete